MDPVTPFDWHRIFIGEQPGLFYVEILVRTALMYLWALLLIRYMGKRGSRNMSPVENVVVIALGSSTGDVMFYPEIPLTYAMIVIALIVAMSRLLAEWQLRSVKVNAFTDGFPLIMLREGQVVDAALEAARLRRDEFFGLLRQAGYEETNTLKLVLMERSGKLSIFCYPKGVEVAGVSTWPERMVNDEVLGGDASYAELEGSAHVLRGPLEPEPAG